MSVAPPGSRPTIRMGWFAPFDVAVTTYESPETLTEMLDPVDVLLPPLLDEDELDVLLLPDDPGLLDEDVVVVVVPFVVVVVVVPFDVVIVVVLVPEPLTVEDAWLTDDPPLDDELDELVDVVIVPPPPVDVTVTTPSSASAGAAANAVASTARAMSRRTRETSVGVRNIAPPVTPRASEPDRASAAQGTRPSEMPPPSRPPGRVRRTGQAEGSSPGTVTWTRSGTNVRMRSNSGSGVTPNVSREPWPARRTTYCADDRASGSSQTTR